MWETFLDVLKKDDVRVKEMQQIKEMTTQPMNTMLAKQSRDAAIKKRDERRKMVIKEVPPTAGLLNSTVSMYINCMY